MPPALFWGQSLVPGGSKCESGRSHQHCHIVGQPGPTIARPHPLGMGPARPPVSSLRPWDLVGTGRQADGCGPQMVLGPYPTPTPTPKNKIGLTKSHPNIIQPTPKPRVSGGK